MRRVSDKRFIQKYWKAAALVWVVAFFGCGESEQIKKATPPFKEMKERTIPQQSTSANTEDSFSIQHAGSHHRIDYYQQDNETLNEIAENLDLTLHEASDTLDTSTIDRVLIYLSQRTKDELMNELLRVPSIDSCIQASRIEGQNWVDSKIVGDGAMRTPTTARFEKILSKHSLQIKYASFEKCFYKTSEDKSLELLCPTMFLKLESS